ncbi:MAG: hypothetical protein V1794_07720 [Candidatus Glassbacteria bacterium]
MSELLRENELPDNQRAKALYEKATKGERPDPRFLYALALALLPVNEELEKISQRLEDFLFNVLLQKSEADYQALMWSILLNIPKDEAGEPGQQEPFLVDPQEKNPYTAAYSLLTLVAERLKSLNPSVNPHVWKRDELLELGQR